MPSTKNFNVESDPLLQCSCGQPGCPKDGVQQWALDKLQKVRDDFGKPMRINSAFRCALHPEESVKVIPGQHYIGVAFDIAAQSGADKFALVALAIKHGARGIGVYDTFVHMDWRSGAGAMW